MFALFTLKVSLAARLTEKNKIDNVDNVMKERLSRSKIIHLKLNLMVKQ